MGDADKVGSRRARSRLGFFAAGLVTGVIFAAVGLLGVFRSALSPEAIRQLRAESSVLRLLWNDPGTEPDGRPESTSATGSNVPAAQSEIVDEVLRIEPSGAAATVIVLREPRILDVEVIESSRREIEFRILHDGATLYSSGVHKGYADGQALVHEGSVTVSVENRDPREAKDVRLRVVSMPIGGDVYLAPTPDRAAVK